MRGPFDFEHADPWSSEIVDVESINALVSNSILERIESVRRAAPHGPGELVSSTLLVLGPAGSGKTHLFARVRRKAGSRAAFVMVRPEIGVEATPRHVLAQIVDSLGRPASGTTDRQLDVIAASMLASVSDDRIGPHMLLEQLRNRDENTREELIERVTSRLEALYPEVRPDYLERLLRAPFLPTPDRRAANAWLAGRELTDVQLSRLGGGPSSLDDHDVLPALRTFALVAAHGAPIVLVFDQLENLVATDGWKQRVAAHGNLVSELHDTVRGLGIVQMALDAEWERHIRPSLAASHRSRVESHLLELALPTAEEREALVRCWLERLPPAQRPHPFPWPFSTAQLEAWRTAPVMTPRMLMIACREAFAAGPQAEQAAAREVPDAQETLAGAHERLRELWTGYLERSQLALLEASSEGRGTDAERLAGALVVAGELANLKASTAMDRTTRVVRFAESGREIRIVQHAHPRSVAAALQHAAGSENARRTVVLREYALAFPPTWVKVEQYAGELDSSGARLAWAATEDVARLLALHDFLGAARSQDLAGSDGRPLAFEVVERWVRQELDWREWPVVRSVVLGEQAGDELDGEPGSAARASHQTSTARVADVDVTSASSAALIVLRRLRVASLDRIVREVRHVDDRATVQSVTDELARAGASVRWYGRRLCAVVEPEP
jgi:Cdc6-like AAA superfamily ATPase